MDEVEEERHDIVPPDIPDDFEDSRAEDAPPPDSLTDDILALLEDGKVYAEAELAFQKSRAGFAANRIKQAVAFGAAAFGVLHLALIALTVGLVIALAPLVGPWLATAIIVALLVAAGLILLRGLKKRIDEIRSAFAEDGE